MIENFPGNEFESISISREIEADLTFGEPHEAVNTFGEAIRSVLNSNSRENSKRTAETAMLLTRVDPPWIS